MNKYLNIRFFAVAALLVITISYSLLYNFTFFPLTEGWFSAYAHLINDGKVPYRDFYLYITPLYVWIISLVTNIFGPSIFVLRILGTIITCLISFFLFRILRAKFSPAPCFAGTVIGLMYYQSGNAYISYDFTQVLTLFSLISISCILDGEKILLKAAKKGASEQAPEQKIQSLFFLSGIFSSCAFLIKQSNGSFIACFIFLAFLYLLIKIKCNIRQKIKSLIAYIIGAISSILITLIYLYINSALEPFIQQILFNAISAKGNLYHILSNWIYGLFTPVLRIQIYEIFHLIAPLYILSLIISFLLKKNFSISNWMSKLEVLREPFLLALFFSLFMGVIWLSWSDYLELRDLFFNYGRHLLNYLIPLSVIWTLFQLFLIVSGPVIPKILAIEIRTAIVAIFVIGLFFGNGTSAGLSEISAFIAVAWIVAWLCNLGSFPLLGPWIALVVCTLLATTFSYSKFDNPYSWWGVSEKNARLSTETFSNPILKNIYVSPNTKSQLTGTILALNEGNKGSILAFPNIPIIYLLTDRWPDTKALIQWFDFLNDYDAINEAERIQRSPPQTIVYLELPEVAWSAHERLFRNGQPLGQRKILKFIANTCISENGYRISYQKKISADSTLYICQKIN